MLYNDEGTSRPTSTDPRHLIVKTNLGSWGHDNNELEELKIVIPTGTNKKIKANAGDVIRYRNIDVNKDFSSQQYRTVVRSIVSKLPGFYMSNYFQEVNIPTGFVSMPQWLTLIKDDFVFHPEMKARYD